MAKSLKPVVLSKAGGDVQSYLRPASSELCVSYQEVTNIAKQREENLAKIHACLSSTPIALRLLESKFKDCLAGYTALTSFLRPAQESDNNSPTTGSSQNHRAIIEPILVRVRQRRKEHETNVGKITRSTRRTEPSGLGVLSDEFKTAKLLSSIGLKKVFWKEVRTSIFQFEAKFQRVEPPFKITSTLPKQKSILLSGHSGCTESSTKHKWTIENHKTIERIHNRQKKTQKELRDFEALIGVPRSHVRRLKLKIQFHENAANLARDKIVHAHLPMVIRIAKSYLFKGLDLKDLVQEGLIGVNRAIQSFDYRKGFRFSTYASYWVKQAIVRAVADQGKTIRIPISQMSRLREVRHIENMLERNSDTPVSARKIATKLNRSEASVKETLSIVHQPISLDAPITPEATSPLVDAIPQDTNQSPVDQIHKEFVHKKISSILGLLAPRQREVIRMRYGIDIGTRYSLQEIGFRLGVSRQRARQIEMRALSLLRDYVGDDLEGLWASGELWI